VLSERVAHLLAQRAKLLRQMLFARVRRGLEIIPRRLLGPEGEDAQQCSGQGSLLVRRKPGGA
jgi:predicted ATPase